MNNLKIFAYTGKTRTGKDFYYLKLVSGSFVKTLFLTDLEAYYLVNNKAITFERKEVKDK